MDWDEGNLTLHENIQMRIGLLQRYTHHWFLQTAGNKICNVKYLCCLVVKSREAWLLKLTSSLLVCVAVLLYRLPDGYRESSLRAEWLRPCDHLLKKSLMAASLMPGCVAVMLSPLFRSDLQLWVCEDAGFYAKPPQSPQKMEQLASFLDHSVAVAASHSQWQWYCRWNLSGSPSLCSL